MRTVLASLIAVALLWTPARAQAPEGGRNQIITHGTGSVEVPPTQAVVSVGVQVQRPTAAEAAGEAGRTAERIGAALQRLGIRPQEMRTSGVQVSPIYTSPRDGAPQLAGFRASYTITLTLSDLRQTGPAIDEAVRAGANTIAGVSFGLKDPSEARRQALTEAVREAREKADAIARAAGLQIRGIERIVEEGVEIPVRVMERAVPAPGAPVPTPIEPGLITVTARVTIVFRY